MTKRSLKGTEITTLSGFTRDSKASIWQENLSPDSAKDNPLSLTLIQDLVAKGVSKGVLDGLIELSDADNDAIGLDTSDAITNVSTTYTVNRVFYLVCAGNIFKVNTGSDVETDTIRLEVSSTEDGMYQTLDIATGASVSSFEGNSAGNGVVNVSNIRWLGSSFSVDIENSEINIGADLIPTTDNAQDLGSASSEFKDLYIDGTAYLDSISCDSASIESLTLTKALDTVTFTVADAVTGGNTGTTGNGYYVDMGSFVIVHGEINNINTTGMTGANNFWIQGFPFATATGTGISAFTGTVRLNTWQFGTSGSVGNTQTDPVLVIRDGESSARVQVSTDNTTVSSLNINDIVSTTSDIVFDIVYFK